MECCLFASSQPLEKKLNFTVRVISCYWTLNEGSQKKKKIKLLILHLDCIYCLSNKGKVDFQQAFFSFFKLQYVRFIHLHTRFQLLVGNYMKTPNFK